MKIKCEACNGTGEIVLCEHMGSYDIGDCAYCEGAGEVEALEEDELDKEILG